MLICSLWTACIQKLPPSQRKRLKCDRFPLGFLSWQQEHWQSRAASVGHCVSSLSFHLGNPRQLYYGRRVPLQQDNRSLLPKIGGCLSLITPRAFGIHNTLRHPVWRRFEFSFMAGTGGAGITTGQGQADC